MLRYPYGDARPKGRWEEMNGRALVRFVIREDRSVPTCLSLRVAGPCALTLEIAAGKLSNFPSCLAF